MEITVLGAGAMGTLYAARLALAGHRVTVVARGARRVAIEAEGLRIRPRRAGSAVTARVEVAPSLSAAGPSDVVLVMVRRQDVDALLPELVARGGDVVTMVNVASGFRAWRAELGARLFVGFPGATGRFEADGTLAYELAPRLLQPTVLGEPEGPPTERVRRLARALREAGFPVQLRDDMEAWQRTHAAWMAPFMLTAAAARGDAAAFASAASVRRWIDAMREALGDLRAQGVVPSPLVIRALAALPPPLLAAAVRGALSSSRSLRAHLLATGEASAGEGLALATELVAGARAPLPALAALVAAASIARSPS